MLPANPPKRTGSRLALVLLSISVVCGVAVWALANRVPAEPPPATAKPPTTHSDEVVRFVALGDSGKPGPAQQQVAKAAKNVCDVRGCDFGVLLGDNLYNRGMTSANDDRMDLVFEPYQATGLPWYMVLGNHDYAHGRNNQRAAWQVDWAARTPNAHMPAHHYSFDAGNSTFVALDTTRVFWGNERTQLPWMSDILDKSTQRWRVVFGHHPYRSNGVHGNAGAYEGWPYVPWSSGATLKRLFDQGLCKHADLYLAGHDHSLQWMDHCGVSLIVSGAGASHTDLPGRGNRTAFEAADVGFVWVELGRRLRVAFFDSSGSLLYEGSRAAPQRP